MAKTQPAQGKTAREWIEDRIRVAGIDLVVVRGGTGTPLLVLHEELG